MRNTIIRLLLVSLLALSVVSSVFAASVYLTDNPTININETDPIFLAESGTLARVGVCGAGQFVVNTTTGGVQCAAPAVTEEGDPVFVANNGSIWGAIDGKLNISDQRYNDTVAIGMRAMPGNCSSGYVVMNVTTSGVECVALLSGNVQGNGTIYTIPIWSNTTVLGDSPLQIVHEPDEDYFSAYNRGLYYDATNQVGGINVPTPESHQATWSVNTNWVDGVGTIATTTYDPVLDVTEVDIPDLVLMPSLGSAARLLENSVAHYIVTVVDSSHVAIEGNWTGANAFSTSAWSYKQASYLDVNGESTSERGISISADGLWKWAMYVPHDSDNGLLCFATGDFGDNLCLDDNGNAVFSGNVTASQFIGGSSGTLNGSGNFGYVPLWVGNQTLGDSPIVHVVNDEDVLNIYVDNMSGSSLLYLDSINHMVGVNTIPGTESHAQAFTVESPLVQGVGTIQSSGLYDPVSDSTLVYASSTLPKSFVDAGSFYVNGSSYYIYSIENTTSFRVRGNWSAAYSSSNWSWRQAPYIDVNGPADSERGYTVSSDGVWQWAMLVPDDSNNSQFCVQNRNAWFNGNNNAYCVDIDGRMTVYGTLTADAVDAPQYPGFGYDNGIIDNGDGTINVSDNTVNCYEGNDYAGTLHRYHVTGGRSGVELLPALATGSDIANYVIADCGVSGTSPSLIISTDKTLVKSSPRYQLYATVIKTSAASNSVHVEREVSYGTGLASRSYLRTLDTSEYAVSSDTSIELSNVANDIVLAPLSVWAGNTKYVIPGTSGSTTGFYVYHNATGSLLMHYVSTGTLLNVSIYDNGSGLVPLSPGNWTVVDVWRGVEEADHLYFVPHTEVYPNDVLAQAVTALAEVPKSVSAHSVFVGRAVFEGGNESSVVTQSYSTGAFFTANPVQSHNSMSGLQGGLPDEYYHLSLFDYQNVLNKVWSGINTTANIRSLGFNTTSQVQLQINQSIVTALTPVYSGAENVYTGNGLDQGGNNVENITVRDGQTYDVRAQNNYIDVYVNFTNVTDFNAVKMYLKYVSKKANARLVVYVWDCGMSSWESYGGMVPMQTFNDELFTVIDPSVHICGNEVSVRLLSVGGDNNDYLYLDYISLVKGFVISSAVLDTYLSDVNIVGGGSSNQTINITMSDGSNYLASIDLSAFNDTVLIAAVNTTANIQSLGFNTTSQLNTVYYPLNSNPAGYYNVTTLPAQSVNMSQIVAAVGNWSADKSAYSNTSVDWANDTASFYPLRSNPAGYYNVTTLPSDVDMFVNGSGLNSIIAYNRSNVASAQYDMALGHSTIANGTGSTAFGDSTVASGLTSTVFGLFSVASGNTAMAWGQYGTASGTYGTAFGYITQASGQAATASGERTTAYGKNSFATGYYSNATAYADFVIGRHNVGGGTFNQWITSGSEPVFEVGIGSNTTNLANALTVYKNGNVTVNNTLYVAGSQVCTAANGLCGSSGFSPEAYKLITTSGGYATTSNSVWSSLSDLSINLTANSNYLIECEIIQDSASTNTGVQVRTSTSNSPTFVRSTYTVMTSNTAMGTYSGTSNSLNTFSTTGASTTESIGQLNTIVTTSGSNSAFDVNFKSETNGQEVRIRAGTFCTSTRVG